MVTSGDLRQVRDELDRLRKILDGYILEMQVAEGAQPRVASSAPAARPTRIS